MRIIKRSNLIGIASSIILDFTNEDDPIYDSILGPDIAKRLREKKTRIVRKGTRIIPFKTTDCSVAECIRKCQEFAIKSKLQYNVIFTQNDILDSDILPNTLISNFVLAK